MVSCRASKRQNAVARGISRVRLSPRTTNTLPGEAHNEVDDLDRRRSVLLCQRHASARRPRLLRPGQHVLRSRADVLRSGSRTDLLRSCSELLQQRK